MGAGYTNASSARGRAFGGTRRPAGPTAVPQASRAGLTRPGEREGRG